MKKAIQIGYGDLFELKCRYAAEAGFRFVAVNLANIFDKTEDEWKAITENIQTILDQNGLSCVQTHLHYYDLLQSSEMPDERSSYALRQSLIASGRLGASCGVYHPRSSISSGFRSDRAYEDNRVILSNLIDDAVNYGLSVAVENIPLFPDHPEWPFYTSDYRDLAVLVDSFNDSHISVCWDFGHANLMKFDQRDALKYLGSRVTCVHIHNNCGFHDDHAAPDTGTADWRGIMPVLTEGGYNGALTLESECGYTAPRLLQSFAKHNYVCLEFLEELMNSK